MVTFSDYVTPNVALNDGSVDVNAFQHKPYLDAQIRDRGFKLVPVGNTFGPPDRWLLPRRSRPRPERKDGAQIACWKRSDQPVVPRSCWRSRLADALKRVPVWKRSYWTSPATRATSRSSSWKPHNCRAPGRRGICYHQQYLSAGQIGLTPTENGLFVEDKGVPYVNSDRCSRENNKDDEKVV